MLIFRLDAELSDWVVTIAHGIDFLEQAFEGLVHVIFENWLLSSFICTIIALTLVLIALDFFEDYSEMAGDHLIYKARRQYFENLSEQKRKQRLSEAEERYQKRKEQNRAEAEERYRKRKEQNRAEAEERYRQRQVERFPLLNDHSIAELSNAYFAQYPERVSFSYGGKTVYNEQLLSRIESNKRNEYKSFWDSEINGLMVREGVSRSQAIGMIKDMQNKLYQDNPPIHPNVFQSYMYLMNNY